MIITQQFVQEVYRFIGNIPLIFRGDKSRPRFSGISNQDVGHYLLGSKHDSPPKELVVLWVKPDIILVDVSV